MGIGSTPTIITTTTTLSLHRYPSDKKLNLLSFSDFYITSSGHIRFMNSIYILIFYLPILPPIFPISSIFYIRFCFSSISPYLSLSDRSSNISGRRLRPRLRFGFPVYVMFYVVYSLCNVAGWGGVFGISRLGIGIGWIHGGLWDGNVFLIFSYTREEEEEWAEA